MQSNRFAKTLWIFFYPVALFALVCGATAGFTQENTPVVATPDAFERFPPLAPEEAEASFVVQDGFQMQLLAAEPMVTDPVAMVYDEDGRAYVVEMNDYPYTDKKTHTPYADNTTDQAIGRVRLLEDLNGDGRFDKSSIFVDGLSWPSGIVCSRGGVYITATPDVWYCKDHDGDGRADERRQVFTGFRKFNVQAVMNNPIWGLDHRLYVAGSSNGGTISSPRNPSKQTWRGDFRFDTTTEAFQPQTGGGRFGNTFNDWGHRFICNIRNPAIQIVLSYESLARNRFYAAPKTMIDVADSGDQLPIYRISPVEPWRELRARQWKNDATKSKTPRSELSGGGVFTSASGLTIYRGNQYGDGYLGQVFLGEVANNVIHRQRLQREGVVYRGERVDKDVEFVASKDTWFRPVNLVNAPDGTLHVLDMYREYIEHPWSIPDDIHARLDLESGRDRGRIYRLAPPHYKACPTPKLGRVDTASLVEFLDHPSSWWRETAQRLLIEREDPPAAKMLEDQWPKVSARGRVHILWTLSILKQLNLSLLRKALADTTAEVREQAVILTAAHPKGLDAMDEIVQAIDDEDRRVRFCAAIALGDIDSNEASEALARLAVQLGDDPWIRAAILSSRPAHTPRVALAYLRLLDGDPSLKIDSAWSRELFSLIGTQAEPSHLEAVIQQWESMRTQRSDRFDVFWEGLLAGLRRSGKSLRSVLAHSESTIAIVEQKLEEARARLTNAQSSESDLLSAIDWMNHEKWSIARPLLESTLDRSLNPPLHKAAVQTLSTFREPEVTSLLLGRWKAYTPAIRESVLTALLARKERTLALLEAVAQNAIPQSTIDAARRSQLINHNDADIQNRSKELFREASSTERSKVVERYKGALKLAGDPERGLAVYTKHCAACHRWRGHGIELGPHLETVQNWDAERILLNLFDPHREVAGQYLSYSILLRDGRTLSGMIAEETATSLTLKQKDSPAQMILLSEIEEVSNAGLSLMPNGLEEQLSIQDAADLLAMLRPSPPSP